ncbi:MAG: proline--tRNA ligase [Anaerolineae bacterium]|nr:proline--tRNA ligase [Anaerolineae bacterium]
MRMSHLFGTTLRQDPADAELVSHRLLVRAGLIRAISAGIYCYLPLAYRAMRKIEEIIRQEMNAIGGQELLLPVVHPAELWKESGRWYSVGPELVRFEDRAGRDMVLAMTHEEPVTDLLRREVSSYRQLPMMIYQFQVKFRDEPRPRGGLVRVREFTMKDGYSAHADFEDLDRYYPQVRQAYENAFRRCGLDAVLVEADPGMMGGTASHEFMVLSEAGEDTLIHCENCGYAANAEAARFDKGTSDGEEAQSLEEVATPGMKTIQQVADFLGVPTSRTAKAVFYVDQDGRIVFAVIRGDLDVNEVKLANVLRATTLRPATDEELIAAGIVPGYASPIGVNGVRVVVDDSVAQAANLVAGANREGYHLRNVNYPRDFQADLVADIALARHGDVCSTCGSLLADQRGIELGHIFKLGTKYSEAMGATYLDAEGRERPIVMGCYGIGIGRLLAAAIEQHHDDKGIIWPPSIAPCQVHVVGLNLDREEVSEAAEDVYRRVRTRWDALLDDRTEPSAGVKFNDADLLGFPVRVTVSSRSLRAGGVEIKARWGTEAKVVPLQELETAVEEALQTWPGTR